ncbi:ABC transporter substrate-binding protein [Rhizobium sp. R693]|uniref:ABC transporter substrate-binding protein n=1 Tax=Rhizobium sp. R693 TaxID=1764276 RepID=UPI000B73A8F9|nr:ABC transporter substrate-binding protein [Rhizobium sp. R693]
MKGFIVGAAGLVAAGVAHSQEALPGTGNVKKVAVLITPSYPPMEYKDPATDELLGLDIDLQLALAKRMNIEVEWSESSFEQLIPSLVSGRGSLIHSGMSDLPKRRGALDFVDYMQSGAQFFTSMARRGEFRTTSDFCGKRVGMPKATSFPEDVRRWSAENCTAAGKPDIIVLGTEGASDTLTQLKQGRIDGGVQGSETLPYIMSQNEGALERVGTPMTSVMQGMAFRKEDAELRKAYADALNSLMDSGEYAAIFKKWDQQDNALDGVYVNGEPTE